jgi:hypothetical protein
VTLCVPCHGLAHGRDFSNRRTKSCPHCGCKTDGRGVGGRCKPCGIKASRAQASSSP